MNRTTRRRRASKRDERFHTLKAMLHLMFPRYDGNPRSFVGAPIQRKLGEARR